MPRCRGHRGGDVCVELADHHLLVPRLLGHVLGAGAGHVDRGLAEEDAGAEHEGDVEDGVDQVHQHLANVSGGDR